MLVKIKNAIESQDFERAINLIQTCEREKISSAEYYNLKAVVAIKMQQYDIAEKSIAKGLKLDNQFIDLYFNLAYLYECQRKYKLAIGEYKKILRLDDNITDRQEILDIIEELKQKLHSNEEVIIKDTEDKEQPQISEDIYVMRENIQKIVVENEEPLVTVLVIAYNNLEKYTKTCVECILKYTNNVDYELVLIDNGSTDGTFEYFKAVEHPRKKIIRITNNVGMFYGGISGINEWKGKYIVTIANDVYVTENWLYNMVICAESDPKIGIVTPVSDQVSSRQKVEWKYSNFEEMQAKAAENNISDPRKWEERLRIISLGTMYKRTCWDMMGLFDYGFIHDFSDDDIAFRARRAGYKVILCKDVFVSHAGEMTDKGIRRAQESLEIGREVFKKKYYGIDAWDDCDNYEVPMIELLDKSHLESKKKYHVLGIDVRCGTPILEIRNSLRREGVFEVLLSAFTTEPKYWLDLHTICEGKVESDRIEYIGEHFEKEKFDYIVIGKPLNEYQFPEKVIKDSLALLNIEGQVLVKVANDKDVEMLLKIIGYSNCLDKQVGRFNLNNLNQCLEERGYRIAKIEKEIHIDKMEEISKMAEMIISINDKRIPQELVTQLIIKNYVVSIKK